MTKSFAKLLVLAFIGTCLAPLVTADSSRFQVGIPASPRFLALNVLIVVAVAIATCIFSLLLKRLHRHLDSNAREQTEFLDRFDVRYVNLAIFGSAALSLFLEL